jgi:hypothetical protein
MMLVKGWRINARGIVMMLMSTISGMLVVGGRHATKTINWMQSALEVGTIV